MKFFDWLFGCGCKNKKDSEVLNLTDPVVVKVVEDVKVKPKAKVVKKAPKKVPEGYVDDETGKVYKTKGALKSAQTRRRNKKAKAAKK